MGAKKVYSDSIGKTLELSDREIEVSFLGSLLCSCLRREDSNTTLNHPSGIITLNAPRSLILLILQT